MEDINIYQMSKTAYLNWFIASGIIAKVCRACIIDGPNSDILLYCNEMVGISDVFYIQGDQASLVALWHHNSTSKEYLIFQPMFWIDHAEWIFSKNFVIDDVIFLIWSHAWVISLLYSIFLLVIDNKYDKVKPWPIAPLLLPYELGWLKQIIQ